MNSKVLKRCAVMGSVLVFLASFSSFARGNEGKSLPRKGFSIQEISDELFERMKMGNTNLREDSIKVL